MCQLGSEACSPRAQAQKLVSVHSRYASSRIREAAWTNRDGGGLRQTAVGDLHRRDLPGRLGSPSRRVRGGRIVAEKSWLVRPGIAISASAQRVHGITPEMVSGAASFREVFPEVEEFFGSSVLLAHNAGRFDVRFLSAEMSRNGIAPPSNDILDTLILFRQWFPAAERHSLDVVATHVGVRITDRHRALGDARCLYEIFCRGLSLAPSDLKLADFASTKGALVQFE